VFSKSILCDSSYFIIYADHLWGSWHRQPDNIEEQNVKTWTWFIRVGARVRNGILRTAKNLQGNFWTSHTTTVSFSRTTFHVRSSFTTETNLLLQKQQHYSHWVINSLSRQKETVSSRSSRSLWFVTYHYFLFWDDPVFWENANIILHPQAQN
jgi:hypothetical protein